MLLAIANGDYASFVSDGDTAFKGLPKGNFNFVVNKFSTRFKAGYDVVYLGELKKRGIQITLWKISFKDGGDDILVTLSLKDGKVGGFWIK